MSRIRVVYTYNGETYHGGYALRHMESMLSDYHLWPKGTASRWKKAIDGLAAARNVARLGHLTVYREPRHVKKTRSRYREALRTLVGPPLPQVAEQPRRTRNPYPRHAPPPQKGRSRIVRMLEQEFLLEE